MKIHYQDKLGRQWSCTSFTYLENTEPGHSKFYVTARVLGPFGYWEFTSWGRIGQKAMGAQFKVWSDNSSIGKIVDEKMRNGYHPSRRDIGDEYWDKILGAVSAAYSELNKGAPLWTFEHVPQVRL